MNFATFFALRQALRTIAAAGVQLVGEDFRLQKALADFAPLAAKLPVFAKLESLARGVIDAQSAQEKVASLLDALLLADAIACTQAQSTVDGEITPLAQPGVHVQCPEIPRSVLAPVLQSLSGIKPRSGGVNTDVVIKMLENNASLRQDFRVQAFLIHALGSKYAFLADKAEEYLGQAGEAIVPLLMDGFEAKGKEMLRRLRLIVALAKGKANDFYLAQLELAPAGAIRQELLQALGLTTDNLPLLFSLYTSERGQQREAVFRGISQIESPQAWEFLQSLPEKKNKDGVAALQGIVSNGQAARFVVECMQAWLEQGADVVQQAAKDKEKRKAFEEYGSVLFAALIGKSGAEVCRLYQDLVAIGTQWDKDIKICGDYYKTSSSLPFSTVVTYTLRESIHFAPSSDLVALAGRFATQTSDQDFSLAYLSGLLLTKSSVEAGQDMEALFAPQGLSVQRGLELWQRRLLKELFSDLKDDYMQWVLGTHQRFEPVRKFIRYWPRKEGTYYRQERPFKEQDINWRWLAALLPLGTETQQALELLLGSEEFSLFKADPQGYLAKMAQRQGG